VESLKELPTLAEGRPPAFRSVVWHGVYAPKGTRRRLSTSSSAQLQSGSRIRLSCCGWPISARRSFRGEGHAGGLRNQLKAEIDRWTPIIRKAESTRNRGLRFRRLRNGAHWQHAVDPRDGVDDLLPHGAVDVDERVGHFATRLVHMLWMLSPARAIVVEI